MPPVPVVFLLPIADHDSGLGQRPEDVDVEALVADAAVERLDVAVAPGVNRPEQLSAGPRLVHRRVPLWWQRTHNQPSATLLPGMPFGHERVPLGHLPVVFDVSGP